MRICLVVHGFPPLERTGVEYYTLGLCRALARAGHRVEVFVPRREPMLSDLALRREDHGGFAVNWITNNQPPGDPREALLVPQLRSAFAAFLERERPQIVHFQHLIKLGTGLVQVARERGLPTVYTAHDYYPICHRYTLLRPDLARCDVRGDPAACARCDLALGHLNGLSGLGDYHAGVLESQLSPEDWRELQHILSTRRSTRSLSKARIADAVAQRTELDRLRAESYRNLDLILAPSRFLLEELVRGGFERERILQHRFHFDNSDLAGLPAVRSDAQRPVRFAFLGGLSKQKGVHVLLDAFARLKGRAELSLWGDSSDRAYVRMVRERSGEVGARMRGSYERSELPEIMAEIDAVVMPSIWVENFPLVIREAFAAGRPVIASDLGAIPESIRDGVDGLLFAPGDARELARVMERCVDDPGLLPRLAGGIRVGPGIEEEVRVLEGHYQTLLTRERPALAVDPLPESLRQSIARFEQLSSLPARELFSQVLAGLDDLRGSWGGELGRIDGVELLAVGLGQGSEAQDRLREARNEIAWLRTKKEEFEEGREELMTLFEDLDRVLTETRAGTRMQAEQLESIEAAERRKQAELQQARERMAELERVIADKNRHLDEVEGQLRDAGRYIRTKDQEYRGLEEELRKAGEFVLEKEAELRAARDSAGHLGRELEVAGQKAELQQAELKTREEAARQLAQTLQAAEERRRALDLGTRSVAEVGKLALEVQTRVFCRALQPILASLYAMLDPARPYVPPREGTSFEELIRVMEELRDGIEAVGLDLEPVRRELPWRRAEMQNVLAVLDGPLGRLLKLTRYGRKLHAWRDGPPEEEGS